MRPVRIWIGLLLLAVGVLGLLGAAHVIDPWPVVGRWWPLAVIGLGVAAMITQRHVSPGPVVVTAIGVLLLAGQLGWGLQGYVIPILLLAVGALVLSGRLRGRMASARSGGSTLALLGGSRVRETSEHFRHADVSAVFGGATLDLREAHLDDGASVDAFAMFGGVDVLVPHGWRIALSGLPIFGGYEDKTTSDGEPPPDAPTLTVNATAMFGGVSVAHEHK